MAGIHTREWLYPREIWPAASRTLLSPHRPVGVSSLASQGARCVPWPGPARPVPSTSSALARACSLACLCAYARATMYVHARRRTPARSARVRYITLRTYGLVCSVLGGRAGHVLGSSVLMSPLLSEGLFLVVAASTRERKRKREREENVVYLPRVE